MLIRSEIREDSITKLVHENKHSCEWQRARASNDTVCIGSHVHDKWVPVTTAWRVFRMRMEEQPPIWRVAANKLDKQSRTADEGWSSSLGIGRGANNASP